MKGGKGGRNIDCKERGNGKLISLHDDFYIFVVNELELIECLLLEFPENRLLLLTMVIVAMILSLH